MFHYTQFSVGGLHTCFVCSDGRAVACGEIVVDQYNFLVLEEDVTYTQVSAGGDRTALM